MSVLTITPNLERKTAKIVGTVSAGEKVSVRLKDCASLLTPTLRVNVRFCGHLMAAFPIPETADAFVTDGDDLTFTLNLCTVQMMRRFRKVPELDVEMVLDDTGADVRQMYFKDFLTVLGWPQNPGHDIPVDLSGYTDKIAALESDIAGMGERIDQHEADVETALGTKVDKEAGKGLSHVDVTSETLGQFASAVEVAEHVENAGAHVSSGDRANWNNKADASDLPKKQDIIVQDGFIYVPDIEEGVWRRMQARYDSDMEGVVTTLGTDKYIRREEDGVFVIKTEE